MSTAGATAGHSLFQFITKSEQVLERKGRRDWERRLPKSLAESGRLSFLNLERESEKKRGICEWPS